MKRFKLLSTLLIGLIGLVSFGYCGTVSVHGTWTNGTVNSNKTESFIAGQCFIYIDPSSCANYGKFYDNNNNLIYSSSSNSNGDGLFCFDFAGYYKNTSSSSCRIRIFNNVIQQCNAQYTSAECQSVYSLIPISSVDSSYCISHNLCSDSSTCEDQYTSEECQQEYSLMPISSCNMEYCGLNGLCPAYSGSLSELYINGINHLSAPIINITIPQEINRSYANSGTMFDLSISGTNVDYEYMDNIIRTQNSKPNTTDLNNIVSVLLPKFVPGLVIILFILFVFRFIKKVF